MTTLGEEPDQETRHHPGFAPTEGRPWPAPIGSWPLDGNGGRRAASIGEPVTPVTSPPPPDLVRPALAYAWPAPCAPPPLVGDSVANGPAGGGDLERAPRRDTRPPGRSGLVLVVLVAGPV